MSTEITEHRRLGHDIRNAQNALMLNAACLKICDPQEALDCVEALIEASGMMIELMDRLAMSDEVDE